MSTISIPVKVTWASMMAAKLFNALRPSRLVLFLFACGMLSVGLAMMNAGPVGLVVPALVVLRLCVMALSAWLDQGASRALDGVLTLSKEELVLTRTDGTVVHHPWTWVLSVAERREVFVLRVNERRGRAILFLRHESLRALGALEQVREWLPRR